MPSPQINSDPSTFVALSVDSLGVWPKWDDLKSDLHPN